eukprot:g9638.t1
MATMPPPPAYSGDKAPPPSYHAQQGEAKNQTVYWVFWGVLFGTVITWIFTVAAAADDAWFKYAGVTFGSFEEDCLSDYGDEEFCSYYTGAKAFQVLAALMVSFTLIAVVVAAFMPAPVTGKLGLASGIMLTLHAVFQLIAFSLMAAFLDKYLSSADLGPTFGVAVVAWLLGTTGAVVSLALLRRATAEQDGPFRACMSKAGGANAGGPPPASAPAGQPGVPVVGAV